MEETLGAQALAQAATPASKQTGGQGGVAQPSWWERLTAGWGNLFDSPLLRLAPLAIVVAAVSLPPSGLCVRPRLRCPATPCTLSNNGCANRR